MARTNARRTPSECWTEGPFGFPMPAAQAKGLEELRRKQPADATWDYKRGMAATAVEEFAPGERADVSIITSAAVDAEREVVLPAGLELERFRCNPVVTFAHRYEQLPVGRALWVKRSGDVIKAKTRYAPRPEGWEGAWLPDAVWHLVRAGDLRGKSIGFLPLEGRPPTADEISNRPEWRRVAWVHTRALLLEYAVAPVQSNPDALVQAIAKGIAPAATLARLGLTPQSASDNITTLTEFRAAATSRLVAALAERDWSATARERLDRLRGRV